MEEVFARQMEDVKEGHTYVITELVRGMGGHWAKWKKYSLYK